MSQADNSNPKGRSDPSDVVIRTEEQPPGPPWPRLGRPLLPPTEEELAAYREGRVVDVFVMVDDSGEAKVWTDPPQRTPPAPGQQEPPEPPAKPS